MGTMLNDEQRERFCVVLVRARNSSNIGAAARAMRDFGFMHLREERDHRERLGLEHGGTDSGGRIVRRPIPIGRR